MRTSKQPILVIEENPRQRTRQTRSWQPRQISCRTIKSHPIRQASTGRGSHQGMPFRRAIDHGRRCYRLQPLARNPNLQLCDKLPERAAYAFQQQGHEKSLAPLSPAQLRRARRFRPCPYSFLYVRVFYRAGTGAVSSTFASRKNFAASSGGVGLI